MASYNNYSNNHSQHAVLAQQCFSGSGCTGGVVIAPGPSAIDCCVGTEEGRSYGSPGDCTISQCIGMHYRSSYFPLHLQSYELFSFMSNVIVARILI